MNLGIRRSKRLFSINQSKYKKYKGPNDQCLFFYHTESSTCMEAAVGSVGGLTV